MNTSSYRLNVLEFRGLLVVRDALGNLGLIAPLEMAIRHKSTLLGGLELNVLTLAYPSSILDGIVVNWISVTSPLQPPRQFKSGDLDKCHELASCPRSSCDAT